MTAHDIGKEKEVALCDVERVGIVRDRYGREGKQTREMGKREDTEVKREDDELDTRGKITRCRRDGSAEVPGRAGQRLLQRTKRL